MLFMYLIVFKRGSALLPEVLKHTNIQLICRFIRDFFNLLCTKVVYILISLTLTTVLKAGRSLDATDK